MKSYSREEEKINFVPEELKKGDLGELELIDCIISKSDLIEILSLNPGLTVLTLVTVFYNDEDSENENPINSIPNFLFNYPNIEHLDLSENEIKSIPPEINQLINLKSLLIDKNQLNDTSFPSLLPDSLEYLDISGNEIKIFPNSIYKLPKLKTLECRHLKLKTIGISKDQFTSLTYLDLSYSSIEESINGISNIGNLKKLNLNSCQLFEFPENIFDLSHLEEINLQNCQVLSDHFEFISNSFSLRKLNMSKVNFETLELKSLNELEHLIMKECKIKNLDIAQDSLSNLKYLDLDNNFIQVLPDSFYSLNTLESIVLNNNQLRRIDSGIRAFEKLRSLRLFKNNLALLPDEFAELSQLKSLNLGQNPIKDIPGLENLKKLKWIDLSGCRELENIDDILERLSFLPELSTISLQWLDVKKLPNRLKYHESLKRINIGRSSLSSEDQLKFQEKFPNIYLWMINM